MPVSGWPAAVGFVWPRTCGSTREPVPTTPFARRSMSRHRTQGPSTARRVVADPCSLSISSERAASHWRWCWQAAGGRVFLFCDLVPHLGNEVVVRALRELPKDDKEARKKAVYAFYRKYYTLTLCKSCVAVGINSNPARDRILDFPWKDLEEHRITCRQLWEKINS